MKNPKFMDVETNTERRINALEQPSRVSFLNGDSAQLDDPYPYYRRLLESAPMHRTSKGSWIIYGHAEAVKLLSNPAFDHWGQRAVGQRVAHPTEEALGHALRAVSPKFGEKFRQAAVRAFSNSVENQAGRMKHRATALLDSLASRSQLDLINDYAHPFTFGNICEIMGIPGEDIPALSSTVAELQGDYLHPALGTNLIAGQDIEESVLVVYFRRLIAFKRKHPAEDLTSTLVELSATASPQPQSDNFLVNLLLLLFYAGHQNMMNHIGLAILALARAPGACRELRRQPALVPNAALELMRFDSPVQYLNLWAREPVDLDGQKFEPDEEIWICVGAANRDSNVFRDPDQLNWQRSAQKQLSFGWGAYRCIGAQLALLQGSIALSSFIKYFSEFHIADQTLHWRSRPIIQRGLYALQLDVLTES